MLIRELEDPRGDITIQQNTTSGELGATVWDAALVLMASMSFFPRWEALLNGKRVLDMSAGTGAVGIAVKKRFPHVKSVTLSDRVPLTPLIEENVARNSVEAHVVPFDWGSSIAVFSELPFDVVLLSDVVTLAYSHDYAKLLDSLYNVTHDGSLLILAYELRSKADQQFFQMAVASGFSIEKLVDWCDPNFYADDIALFKLARVQADDLYLPPN